MLLLPGRVKQLATVAFSGDGRFATAGGVGGLFAWDLSHPAEGPTELSNEPTMTIKTLPGGGVLAVPRAWLWQYDLAAGTAGELRPGGRRSTLYDPRVSPDGTRILAGGNMCRFRCYNRTARGLSLRWELVPQTWDYPRAEFLPPGDRIIFLERHRTDFFGLRGVRVRATNTGKVLGAWICGDQRKGLPDHFVVSPDGSTLVMGFGATFELWDTARAERPLQLVKSGRRSRVLGMAFHPEGGVLATVGNEEVVRFWNTQSWTEHRVLTWSIGKLSAIAFSPDGTRAAVGSTSGHVLVWDVDL
jgi:WD40 repeat protein